MKKLVHIRKYTDLWAVRHLEIVLCGIRIRIPYGNWKAYRKKRKQRRHEKRQKRFAKKIADLRAANQAYLTHKKDRIIRRLFFTSGNLQLFNVMAIISQLAENEIDPSENHIIVWSTVTNDDFEKTNRKIAELCGIRHYYSCCGRNWNPERFVNFINEKKHLMQIDEIYSLGLWTPYRVIEMLYQDTKCIIMDEGTCSLIPAEKKWMMRYCKKMLSTFYLNKLDYVSFPDRTWTVEHVQQKYFHLVANKCTSLYPIEIPHHNATNKYIIFCGNYSAFFFSFTEEEMETRQEQLIQKLIDRGYHVLYKPHPRDPVKRSNREGVTILRTRLPLECYQLNGIAAVVSLCSSASTQSYHFNKTPGFIDEDFTNKTLAPHLAVLMNEYTPPVEILLELDARNMEPEDLRREIVRRYEEYLADKPLLSQNEKFNQVYHKLFK